ncbi:MAG: U32 family peptidase [Lachnospiraceae bacterium]|jgi:putative protease|nr:U32 family peptidase [Lachnospiraceae bacterium]
MKPELLIPAGSLDTLKTAIRYGADAVYIGGEAFSLRAKAKNFTIEKMPQALALAHAAGVKVYITANILAHNRDLDDAKTYFAALNALRPDALIIADPGLFSLARDLCPETPVHISTQAGNTNYLTYRFWHGQGARRAVAARELSLAELADIRAHIPADMELEAFVHGAMCVAYSGRCLLSSYFTGRSANRGECAHPCRWQYAVAEETRPGEYLPIEENERGTFLFNSRDLSMIEHIPALINAGIDSFKVEGRMKNALYIATVTRAYRRAIDDYCQSEQLYGDNMEWYKSELGKCTNRQYTTGFYFGEARADVDIRPFEAGDPYDVQPYVYLGTVRAVDNRPPIGETQPPPHIHLTQKNKFAIGDQIEIMKPNGENIAATVLAITAEGGRPMDSAPHAGQALTVTLSAAAEVGDVLRKVEQ